MESSICRTEQIPRICHLLRCICEIIRKISTIYRSKMCINPSILNIICESFEVTQTSRAEVSFSKTYVNSEKLCGRAEEKSLKRRINSILSAQSRITRSSQSSLAHDYHRAVLNTHPRGAV